MVHDFGSVALGPAGGGAVNQPVILIVEDDVRIAEVVVKNLESAGFTCHAVHHGGEGWERFLAAEPDLLILDVMLPGLDGIEITRRVRKRSRVPILVLTARKGEGDTVLALEVGADNYLTKPFRTRELIARVRALLRRASAGPEVEVLARGALRIDPGRRAAERDGEPVALTTLEFDLLYFLAGRVGRVFSREALMEQVWGEDRVVDPRSIDSLISRLRRKLERDPGNPEYIQTVWGAGYRFAEP